MDDLEQKFRKAAEEVKQLKSAPSDSDLLRLYGLYKQATVGDVTAGPEPGPGDFVAEAKREAWSKLKGVAKEQAMRDYIELVEKLKQQA